MLEPVQIFYGFGKLGWADKDYAFLGLVLEEMLMGFVGGWHWDYFGVCFGLELGYFGNEVLWDGVDDPDDY